MLEIHYGGQVFLPLQNILVLKSFLGQVWIFWNNTYTCTLQGRELPDNQLQLLYKSCRLSVLHASSRKVIK